MKSIIPILTTFFLLLNTHNSIGQEFLTMEKEDIKWMYNDADSVITYTDLTNALEVTYDAYEKFIATYYFNDHQECDSIIVQYYCSECAKAHLNDILADDKERWTATESNTYISAQRTAMSIGLSKDRLSECKQMIIVSTPEQEICTTITFSIIQIKTSDWKKIAKATHGRTR